MHAGSVLQVYASAGAEGMQTSRQVAVETLAPFARLRQQPVTLTNQVRTLQRSSTFQLWISCARSYRA